MCPPLCTMMPCSREPFNKTCLNDGNDRMTISDHITGPSRLIACRPSPPSHLNPGIPVKDRALGRMNGKSKPIAILMLSRYQPKEGFCISETLPLSFKKSTKSFPFCADCKEEDTCVFSSGQKDC